MSYEQLVTSVDNLAEQSAALKIAAQNVQAASESSRDAAGAFAIDALASVGEAQAIALQAPLDAAAAAGQLLADLSDPTDLAKGAAGLGRGVVSVASNADLLLSPRKADLIYLVTSCLGGWATLNPYRGPRGGGTWIWDPLSTTPADGGTVLQVEGVVTGRFKRVFSGAVEVTWFGALGIGTDDSVAILAAHATQYNVHYPWGSYKTSTVQVKPGCKITGIGGGRFLPEGARKTTVTSLSPGQLLFDQSLSVSPGQEEAFWVSNICLFSDFPIRYNDPTKTIVDGAGATNPYLMRPMVMDVSLTPLTVGSGTGVSLAKCFDGEVTRCEFNGFAIGTLLLGSDLNDVTHNRYTNIYQFGVLNMSCATFGSQNEIYHNDMVRAEPAAIFIKTNERHPRIRDNYMEQASGSCTGFIDVSDIGMPVYGANVASTTRMTTIEVLKNRIDGHTFATGFVQRIDLSLATYADIEDVGTPSTQTYGGIIVGDSFTPRRATLHNRDISIRGRIFGKWHGYRTEQYQPALGGVVFNSRDLTALQTGKDQTNNLQISGPVIVMPATFAAADVAWVVPGGDVTLTNVLFALGVTYTVTIVARSKSATGDTLRAASGWVGGGAVLTDMTLTDQFKKFTFTFPGRDALTTGMGIYMRRSTQNGDIEIQSITITQ